MVQPIAQWLREVEQAFAEHGSAERAVQEKAYMKSELRFHGVTMPMVRSQARAFCKAQPELTRAQLVAFAKALFESDWFDLRSFGAALLERKVQLLIDKDAVLVEKLVLRAQCWAHVDLLATKVLGPLLVANPQLADQLYVYAKSKNFWVRRLALLAEHDELRAGAGDFARFSAIAAPLLAEKEFFIRKAIGWVLREVSKKRPELTHAFVKQHRAEMSGLTFREATRHLPAKLLKTL